MGLGWGVQDLGAWVFKSFCTSNITDLNFSKNPIDIRYLVFDWGGVDISWNKDVLWWISLNSKVPTMLSSKIKQIFMVWNQLKNCSEIHLFMAFLKGFLGFGELSHLSHLKWLKTEVIKLDEHSCYSNY